MRGRLFPALGLVGALLGATLALAQTGSDGAPNGMPDETPDETTVYTMDVPDLGSVPVRDGLAAFERIYEVVSHPRCANCHVGPDNVPMWYGATGEPPAQPHGMNVNAGDSRIGVEYLPCSTCHRVSEDFDDTPHAPPRVGVDWALAPVEMEWFGKSPPEICAQLSDPERTGGRDWVGLAEHLVEDASHHGLVLWGFEPSGGREGAPHGVQAHIDDILAWGAAGMPCPVE